MPRFVLLHHTSAPDYKPDHWDLMLEQGERLLTWELSQLPRQWQELLGTPPSEVGVDVKAVKLSDHRLVYLDYEGPLTGNRGFVRRIASGECLICSAKQDEYHFVLSGCSISGEVQLQRTGSDWNLHVANA